MHYRTALGGAAQTAGLPEAAAPFAPVIYKPASVVLNTATLPATTEVWVMEPAADSVAVNAAGFTRERRWRRARSPPSSASSPARRLPAPVDIPGPQTGRDRSVRRRQGGSAVLRLEQQVNFQVPAAQPAGQVLAEVRVGGQVVAHNSVTLIPSAPGVFAVANQDGRVNTVNLPAHPGETLHIYATGQGAVTPAVDDGAAAPALRSPPAPTFPMYFWAIASSPSCTTAWRRVRRLWQLDVAIPKDAPTGPAMVLSVVNGIASNPIPVAVVRE